MFRLSVRKAVFLFFTAEDLGDFSKSRENFLAKVKVKEGDKKDGREDFKWSDMVVGLSVFLLFGGVPIKMWFVCGFDLIDWDFHFIFLVYSC